jgi:hypothetical protein
MLGKCCQAYNYGEDDLVFERLYESETFCSVGFEYEGCLALAAACSVHLPDPSFRIPTWPVRLPP